MSPGHAYLVFRFVTGQPTAPKPRFALLPWHSAVNGNNSSRLSLSVLYRLQYVLLRESPNLTPACGLISLGLANTLL